MKEAALWDRILQTNPIFQGMEYEQQIVNFLGLLETYQVSEILEVGCGCGRNLVPMAEKGFTVVGVDHSVVAVDTARKNLIERNLAEHVQLINRDWTHFTQNFPAVLAWHVLGHGAVEEVEENISKLISLTAENGFCLFNIPCIKTISDSKKLSPTEAAFSFVYEDGDEAGIRHSFFSYDRVEKILQDRGVKVLSISEVQSYGRFYIEVLIQK